MRAMLSQFWCRTVPTSSRVQTSRSPPRGRLQVEALEPRQLPGTLSTGHLMPELARADPGVITRTNAALVPNGTDLSSLVFEQTESISLELNGYGYGYTVSCAVPVHLRGEVKVHLDAVIVP